MNPSIKKFILPKIYETMYHETADGIVDAVLKKLMVLDALDALQDIFLQEAEVIFAFDPIMEPDEIQVILAAIKQRYPQAMLVGVPQTAEWWVVSIANMAAAQQMVPGIEMHQQGMQSANAVMPEVNGNLSPSFIDQSIVNKAVANL